MDNGEGNGLEPIDETSAPDFPVTCISKVSARSCGGGSVGGDGVSAALSFKTTAKPFIEGPTIMMDIEVPDADLAKIVGAIEVPLAKDTECGEKIYISRAVLPRACFRFRCLLPSLWNNLGFRHLGTCTLHR